MALLLRTLTMLKRDGTQFPAMAATTWHQLQKVDGGWQRLTLPQLQRCTGQSPVGKTRSKGT